MPGSHFRPGTNLSVTTLASFSETSLDTATIGTDLEPWAKILEDVSISTKFSRKFYELHLEIHASLLRIAVHNFESLYLKNENRYKGKQSKFGILEKFSITYARFSGEIFRSPQLAAIFDNLATFHQLI